jgi:1,4-dihydroxy-2-naphthoate polyprenyltransferase
MTHYSNDYFDLDADRANPTPTNWSGGSRILPDGLLPPRIALITACIFLAIASFAALVLAFVIVPAPLTLPLLALAILLAWFYSAPPLRLHSRGVGELAGALLIPGLTPLVGFYLQTGRLEWLPFLAVFPLCCLQFAMLLAIEFPDAAGDRAAGKRTLVVRLGEKRASRLYGAVLSLPYLALPLLVIAGLPSLPAIGIALFFPLVLWQFRCLRRGDYANPARWNTFAFFSIALFIASAIVETITFALVWAST